MEKEPEEFTIPRVDGTSTVNRPTYEDYLEGLNDRRAKGRYTLEEAALELQAQTGEDAKPMLDKLVRAVRDGVLPVHAPGESQRYQPEAVRDFYDEVFWDELNAWLVINEKRVAWRFPRPEAVPTLEADQGDETTQPKISPPLQRQQHQENEILRVIAELKYNAKALAKNKPGLPGVKSKVQRHLTSFYFTKKVFDKAWERLREQGEIKNTE